MTVLLGALAFLAVASAPPAAPPPSAAELARLSFQNDLLGKQLALAKGKEFYLLVDPEARSLKLMYRGALLQRYSVERIEVGVPRIVFHKRAETSDWEGRVWDDGALDPPRELDRVEVQAPPPSEEGTEMPVQVPPTPEEKYPVPPRYHIRFAGGLSIEVRTPASEARTGWWAKLEAGLAAWWADAKAAASPRPTDALRLHLSMSKTDAESLYRALPPATKLLVVPQS